MQKHRASRFGCTAPLRALDSHLWVLGPRASCGLCSPNIRTDTQQGVDLQGTATPHSKAFLKNRPDTRDGRLKSVCVSSLALPFERVVSVWIWGRGGVEMMGVIYVGEFGGVEAL